MAPKSKANKIAAWEHHVSCRHKHACSLNDRAHMMIQDEHEGLEDMIRDDHTRLDEMIQD